MAAVPITAQAPGQPGQPDKSRVTAGTYIADKSHSLIAWKVNHFGFNDYFGLFGDVDGVLTIDPANPAKASVTATIPVSKVVTVNPELTARLLRPAGPSGKADFFGAAPADAKFVSTSVVPREDGTSATINGNLTLNGVTKPVSFDASFAGAGTNPFTRATTLGFQARARIKRSDFGSTFLLPMLADEVSLSISMAFVKKPG
jgi:polyisoprenoid-binding protein YceI